MPSPKDIGRALAATDALGLHREAVRIPLDTSPDGQVAIEGGKLVITLPSTTPVDAFLAALPARVRALPGHAALRRAEG